MYYAILHCIVCKKEFKCNPHIVPSTRAFGGERKPVCKPCFEEVNHIRQEVGLEPFPIKRGAYEPGIQEGNRGGVTVYYDDDQCEKKS